MFRTTRETNGLLYFCSICARASSTSFPYLTPEGHAVSHARQSRQRSMCVVKDSTARRVRFLSPQTVRGAMIQAKTAVDAIGVVGVLRVVHRAEAAESERKFALRFFVGLRST